MVSNRQKGKEGEDIAADFLVNKGYTIRDRNYRVRRGEIDIIAEKEGSLVFVEVKCYRHLPEQEVGYLLDRRKQRRIIGVSKEFLWKNRLSIEGISDIRYDVIYINRDLSEIKHWKDAFSETTG